MDTTCWPLISILRNSNSPDELTIRTLQLKSTLVVLSFGTNVVELPKEKSVVAGLVWFGALVVRFPILKIVWASWVEPILLVTSRCQFMVSLTVTVTFDGMLPERSSGMSKLMKGWVGFGLVAWNAIAT